MKFIYYLSAGLLAMPFSNCLPLAVAGVENARDVDAPSVYEYGIYKKRDADVDTPSVYEYGIYKKRYADRAFLAEGYGQRLSQLMTALRRKYKFGGSYASRAERTHAVQQSDPQLELFR